MKIVKLVKKEEIDASIAVVVQVVSTIHIFCRRRAKRLYHRRAQSFCRRREQSFCQRRCNIAFNIKSVCEASIIVAVVHTSSESSL